MSFNRYFTIFHPCRHSTIMTSRVCFILALTAWFGGFFSFLPQTVMVLRLPFCSSNVVDHFYCNSGPMLKITGGNTHLIEALGFLITVAVILSSLLLAVVSYIFIVSTVLHIPSSSGPWRAFSTCDSHLIVAGILYGPVFFIYFRPFTTRSSFNINKAVFILNAIITPVHSPFMTPGPSDPKFPVKYVAQLSWEIAGPNSLTLASLGLDCALNLKLKYWPDKDHVATFQALLDYTSHQPQPAQPMDRMVHSAHFRR
ncbi:olfactory receptor 6X1-like [Rhineura floridana]|uniref:olfactory receptor 6X1-like n=1 Tax=Rhineura floridana TaxID=261503 RepID=UPI002AC87A54|nr:olfactory receptor 6X1-like [Rhineura floridana]